MQDFKKTKTLLAAAATAALLAACSTTAPTIQTGPDAEVTFDGLNRVDNSQADVAWARPDFDISQYTKIMLVGAGVQYREADNMGRTTTERSRGGPFYLDADRRARFEALVADVFTEELAQIQNFEIVEEPGPDVLTVRGALLDVVSFVPDMQNQAGRFNIILASVGEVTLVLELRDSQSGTVLARSVDRRAAQRAGGTQGFDANRVTVEAEVRRLMRFWARRLREGLDGFVEQQRNM
jgi:hypothetical protein